MRKSEYFTLYIIIIGTAAIYLIAASFKIRVEYSNTSVYNLTDLIMDYVQMLVQLFLFVIVLLQARQTQVIMNNDMKKFQAEHSANLVATSTNTDIGFYIYNQGTKVASDIQISVPKDSDWSILYAKIKEKGSKVKMFCKIESGKRTLLPGEQIIVGFPSYFHLYNPEFVPKECKDLLEQLEKTFFEFNISYFDNSSENVRITKRLKISIFKKPLAEQIEL